MEISVALDPNPAEGREAVLTGLAAYNQQFLGPVKRGQLVVTAKDGDGKVVGGATGYVYYDRLSIDLVWIDEAYRGAGLGSRVLRQIEEESRKLGAVRSFLDTFGFQAAPFYEKQGYVEVARIVEYWDGYDRIYLAKVF